MSFNAFEHPQPVTGISTESDETDAKTRFDVKRVVEAVLFASKDPVPLQRLREITDSVQTLAPKVLLGLIRELQVEYTAQQRAFELVEVGEGFLLQTRREYSGFVDQLYRTKRTEKLSPASTEVLAIIAYRQPISRAQIDAIRGVDSSGVLHGLIERGLIEGVGRLEVPGRPTAYGVTKAFLLHFGLSNVEELKTTDA